MLITDVQALLRHKSLVSTQVYLRCRLDELVERMREHYATPRPSPRPSPRYDPVDMATLFPGTRS